MSKPAFPLEYTVQDYQTGSEYKEQEFGISQRLYIATKIAAGGMKAAEDYAATLDIKGLVSMSYKIADELIKQDNNTK